VIATGSRPRLPDIAGITAADPLTTDTIWDLPAPPSDLTILGAGPAGVELAQAFARLGIEVCLIHRYERILPRHEPSLAAILEERLASEGVELVGGVDVTEIQQVERGARMLTGRRNGEEWSHEANALLVCCGRSPNLESLDIEGAGIDHASEGILTDDRSRSSAKCVYAVGDVAGRSFTHTAGHDGAMAIRDMALPGAGRRAAGVPSVVFTDPELATAGFTYDQAIERFPRKRIERLERDLANSDRARTDGDPPGRVVVVAAGGRVAGVHVLAPGAGEAVGGLQREVVARTRLSSMARRIEAYPTRTLEVQRAIGDRELERAKRIRSWIPRVPFL
jgi:pyruvate/2-oxoglutarate dehydrogenase complex dihydrolipoamide dehydrogenase (E3) component